MPDHFKSSRLRLARARKHITDLAGEVKRFRQEKPWTHVKELHANGVLYEHKIRFTGKYLDDFALIAADAIHNLRSALDQAGNASARASGVPDPKIGTAAFPFGLTESDVDNAIGGRCNNIPPDIRALMREQKPYKTGNPILWAVNSIRNVDTHALIKPTRPDIPWGTVTIQDPNPNIYTLPEGPRWNAANNELIFATSDATKPDTHYDVEFIPTIAFGDVEIVGGKPVVGTLSTMASEVRRILRDVEAETRRFFPNAFL